MTEPTTERTETPARAAEAPGRPRILITMGDPNGIGPEVVLKSLTDARLLKYVEPVIVGVAHVLHVHAQRLGLTAPRLYEVDALVEAVPEDTIQVLDLAGDGPAPEVVFGSITEEGGRLSMQAVEVATDLCRDGRADAMVTAPISKEAISRAGYTDPGHTEFIARRVGAAQHTMMMVADRLRIALVTGHLPIWDVPRHVTHDAILEKLRIVNDSLKRDFGIDRPRIAVLGLNPHAGDGGILGREEEEAIVPAIRAACDAGLHALGPFPADGFFAVGDYRNYDAVLAMYHDQGLVPFKTLAFEQGVNYTAGLPIVRTSPDHGTAYGIAGTGRASPGSMRSALFLALDIARRRRTA